MKDGRVRWNCIHRLQRISAGRRPVRPTAALKEDGELTQGPTEVLERWHQHFKKLLNMKSVFNVEVINAMAVLPLHLDLDYPPTTEELDVALSKLKNKAGGLIRQEDCLGISIVWWTSLVGSTSFIIAGYLEEWSCC